MRFTVLWARSAEQELAEAWLNAQDRKAVAVAAGQIDATLRNDPLDCGESRSGNRRFFSIAPLGIDFQVFPDDMRVLVRSVWLVN